MEYKRLGKTDINVSAITFGCWAIGAGKEWGSNLDDSDYIRTVLKAYENGVNFFDTASGYGNGHSEEVLGKAIHDIRDKVIISSKCASSSLIKGKTEDSIDSSLKRLNTDYIDVFLIHWPNPDIDISENMEQLMLMKEKGKIRSIGVSNYTVNHLRKAVKYGQVDVFQPCYNLYWRQIEKQSLPFCIDHDIAVMTYSSIASGLLTGKFTSDWKFEKEDMRNEYIALFKKEVYEKAIEINEKLKVYAKRYQKSLTQIAINWVINQPGITTAIVGAKTPEQVIENVKAIGWTLSEEDYDSIDKMTMKV
ncbi:MAG: aldo/keto reductase, partial [Clostridia bacterium]|nr:aldo/keto reductase [Clostridia bacterium]